MVNFRYVSLFAVRQKALVNHSPAAYENLLFGGFSVAEEAFNIRKGPDFGVIFGTFCYNEVYPVGERALREA